MDIRMYIMAHKEFDVPQVDGYIPLHVGKVGKQELGYIGDDTAENISDKNASFCELTGLYWMWKNVSCDVVGLCHYRRYFVQQEMEAADAPLEQKLLRQEQIEKYLQEYDAIVPNSVSVPEGSVWNHYMEHHNIADWLECAKVILEKCPQYYTAFVWHQNSNLITLGNMVIARKELLDEYCKWLFDILFEVERRIDISSYDAYQKRVFGFLSERLFRVWLMNQPFRVKEIPIIFLE